MLVEDNFIIAKELSDLLGECGFTSVEMASNVKSAQALLESFRPDLAILDVNLGPDSNSEPIALQLLEMGVPFFFLTGYGDQAELAAPLKDVPILTKPVSKPGLLKAISNL